MSDTAENKEGITVVEPVKWVGGVEGCVELIDQTVLPGRYEVVAVREVGAMWEAIRRLQVRGAPAIGIAAAFGAVLGVREVAREASAEEAREALRTTCAYLGTSRPTAVNLFWALERMERAAAEAKVKTAGELAEVLLREAEAIRAEDAAMCRAIGRHGAGLIRPGYGVLTHCNAGGLATASYGTALAAMFTAHEAGVEFRVYVDETRPLLQGARLTAWELLAAGIPATLICDNMAGVLMKQGKVQVVITGADRIAANGDAANKIGTYSVAVLAKVHGIPFYVAAPSSTFDLTLANGAKIPIEERDAQEVRHFGEQATAPANVEVYNPAFDVTEHELIAGIVTEHGVIERPDREKVGAFFAKVGQGK